jgi:signal transduction histidine kinase
LTIVAYSVDKNPLVLTIGFGSCILILVCIFLMTLNNFSASKVFNFVSAYIVVCVVSILFPFIRFEYFLMPLIMLSVFATYPFQNQKLNFWIGIICIVTSIFLFILESFQPKGDTSYDFFNLIFVFILVYIATIEIIFSALIANKYEEIILKNRKALELKNIELAKYIDSNLQLENFAHLASHDLKTPLSNVIRFSQLLKYKISDKLSDKEAELFDFVIDGSMNMNATINSLFQFSQATNKKMDFRKFMASELLRELESDIQLDLEEKQVSIKTVDMNKQIYADRSLVKQLFLNLILNSIKFVQKGIKPNIVISCIDMEGFLKFSVKDNGIGIDPEYQEVIFLIFKRLHDNSQYKGTGAGLAICKKIVEQHGGEIWVESKPTEGSTFYFTIENAA